MSSAQYRFDADLAADREHCAAGQGTAAIDRGARKSSTGCGNAILCFCCTTACPSYMVEWRALSRPAVLLQAYRWIAGQPRREDRRAARTRGSPFRLYRCHTILNCTRPAENLNPAKAIAEIKKLLVLRR